VSNLDVAFEVACEFDLKNSSLSERNDQFLRFSRVYARLNPEEASVLRASFDAKDRLAFFHSAASLLLQEFSGASKERKFDLLKIFFSLYSFENLEFGFDGVLDVIAVSEKVHDFQEISKKAWEPFREITSNITARKNLESKLFS